MSQVFGQPFAVIPKRVLFSDVSVNAKTLYGIFACYVDQEGRCYPGRKQLAKLMGVSEETVKRAKKELVDAELIECRERFDSDGRRTTDDVILTHARVTGDPYPRVTGDPTGTRPRLNEINTYAPMGQNRPSEASRYPELKRPAREQRILDGEFGQQH